MIYAILVVLTVLVIANAVRVMVNVGVESREAESTDRSGGDLSGEPAEEDRLM
ncbi:MAG TPA: hypothetical protein VLY82_05760 [Nitrososphaerales archaeon]|nr:hypothetical protein [Nitrososphaerales archaeon]